jgi:glycosyltransferase involved in cell wall biosynthesis
MPLALAALAGSAAFAAYTLVGYPVILLLTTGLRARIRHQAARGDGSGRAALRAAPPPDAPSSAGSQSHLPTVSITLPAYNEEVQIREAIESLLALEYPARLRQILIVSDGSTDGTDRIVRSFGGQGVELLRVEGRRGKSAVENAARAQLRGEIIVNTDASIRHHPAALKALVAAFLDPGVGVASARDLSIAHRGADVNAGESGYVGYEMWVRDLETTLGGIVGASGCMYAIRSELHRTPVPGELSRDFSSALIARERGFRAVSVRDAICYVPRAGSLRREYSRKVRTVARGLRTLFARRHLMNPLVHGAFAWKLLSHKLCRWLLPWALVVASVALLALVPGSGWARWLAGAGGVFGIAAIAGWLWPEGRDAPRFVTLPAFLLVGNTATLHAWLRVLRGRRDAIWEPTRRVSSRGSEDAATEPDLATADVSAGGDVGPAREGSPRCHPEGEVTTPRS